MFINKFYQHIFNRERTGDIIYLSSQFLTPAVGFVTNIVAAKFILPYELGIIQTVMLISVYCSFIHLGVFNGLNRNIAFYDSQNNKEKIQKIVDASWLVAVISAIVGVLISIIAGFYFILSGHSSLYLYSVAIILGLLVFTPICTHYETIYRSSRAFLPLGIYLNFGNLINLLLGILPAIVGAFGLIARYAVFPAVTFLLLFRKSPLKHCNPGQIKEVVELARIGFPMLFTGVLYVVFTAADRTIVAFMLGPAAVGELALSGFIITGIQVLPLSIGALLYPRAAYIFGSAKTSAGLKNFFFTAWHLM